VGGISDEYHDANDGEYEADSEVSECESNEKEKQEDNNVEEGGEANDYKGYEADGESE
jgi:hypothetical protein